jgi:hypothetical protein
MLCVSFVAAMVLMRGYDGLWIASNVTEKSGHRGIRMTLKSKIIITYYYKEQIAI